MARNGDLITVKVRNIARITRLNGPVEVRKMTPEEVAAEFSQGLSVWAKISALLDAAGDNGLTAKDFHELMPNVKESSISSTTSMKSQSGQIKRENINKGAFRYFSTKETVKPVKTLTRPRGEINCAILDIIEQSDGLTPKQIRKRMPNTKPLTVYQTLSRLYAGGFIKRYEDKGNRLKSFYYARSSVHGQFHPGFTGDTSIPEPVAPVVTVEPKKSNIHEKTIRDMQRTGILC
jgi:hypothetical protein